MCKKSGEEPGNKACKTSRKELLKSDGRKVARYKARKYARKVETN